MRVNCKITIGWVMNYAICQSTIDCDVNLRVHITVYDKQPQQESF